MVTTISKTSMTTPTDTNKLLAIVVGPTGIGKTSVGIQLARHFNTEIISCDSRQFYRELKIGTAAPTEEEMQAVPHHLVGNIGIHDYYNAYVFDKDANRILSELFRSTNVVIMVGGSGMYVDALCTGIDEIPDIEPELRNRINKEFEEKGIEYLRHQLKLFDEEYYRQVDLMNPKRLIRAIEVYHQTGKPFSSFRKNKSKPLPYNVVKIGLELPRQEIYERINSRVDKMMDQGLESEARQFYNQRHLNSLNTVGYKELFSYFDGETSLEKTVELIKRNTRHYAKKQLSWFKRDTDIHWHSPNELNKMIELISGAGKF